MSFYLFARLPCQRDKSPPSLTVRFQMRLAGDPAESWFTAITASFVIIVKVSLVWSRLCYIKFILKDPVEKLTMFVTSFPSMRGLFSSAHIEKWVTAQITIRPCMPNHISIRQKIFTVFVVIHAPISDLKHIKIIPVPRTGFLTYWRCEVDDTGHCTIWNGTCQILKDIDHKALTKSREFTINHICARTTVVIPIKILLS